MGECIDGKWSPRAQFPTKEGRFVRKQSSFRDWIRSDGSTPYAPEKDRYHLYVSYACPWAHRTLILRKLKGLDAVISFSVVNPLMGDEGWTFAEGPGVIPDPIHQAARLRDVYQTAQPDYTGRVTVPLLWDRKSHHIVNNESRELIRMFDREFGDLATTNLDLCPRELEAQIDETLDAIYEPINNGVYRAGFARTQDAYDEAVEELFQGLDRWEKVLSNQRYLCGDRLTEADICLFTTLFRFDSVYHTHFKCNVKRIVDYPSLWAFTRDIYQTPGISETCSLDHIRRHYYESHGSINPTRIVARGPSLDFEAPHHRG